MLQALQSGAAILKRFSKLKLYFHHWWEDRWSSVLLISHLVIIPFHNNLRSCIWKQGQWTQARLTSLYLSIFMANTFCYVINCISVNRVTVYGAKCFGTVTLKVYSASFFPLQLERKSTKLMIREMKLNRNNTRDHVSYSWYMAQFFNSEHHCWRILPT